MLLSLHGDVVEKIQSQKLDKKLWMTLDIKPEVPREDEDLNTM